MLSQYQGNVPTLCAVRPSWLAAGLKLTSPHTMHERDGTKDLTQAKCCPLLFQSNTKKTLGARAGDPILVTMPPDFTSRVPRLNTTFENTHIILQNMEPKVFSLLNDQLPRQDA